MTNEEEKVKVKEKKVKEKEVDFNVFVGAETGILKGVHIHRKGGTVLLFHLFLLFFLFLLVLLFLLSWRVPLLLPLLMAHAHHRKGNIAKNFHNLKSLEKQFEITCLRCRLWLYEFCCLVALVWWFQAMLFGVWW